MGTIVINGKKHAVSGNNITVTVVGNAITVNGKPLEENLSGVVRIEWDGPLANLTSDASVTCKEVHGDVDAGGSVSAGDVRGNVTAGGSVHCGAVGGRVHAGGSVIRR